MEKNIEISVESGREINKLLLEVSDLKNKISQGQQAFALMTESWKEACKEKEEANDKVARRNVQIADLEHRLEKVQEELKVANSWIETTK